MVDLDAIQARIDAAMHHEGETNGYVLAQRWYRSAKDVPALIAELRAARQQLDEYEHLRSTLVTRFNLGSALRPALVAEWVIAIYDKAVG